MNIVYHFRVRGSGAEAVHIAGIANGFRSLGHEVEFVSPSGVDPTAPALAHVATPATSPLVRALHLLADHAPQVLFEAMELGYNAFALPKLAAAIREHRPQLIYERYAFFNAAGALAAAAFGIPLVVEVNELAGFERVRDQRLVWLAKAIERRVFRRASLVVTVSDFLNEQVGELTGGTVPVVTIPNGVSQPFIEAQPDAATAARLRADLDLGGRPVIAFIGGLVHWHNFDLLLETIAGARRSAPDAVLLIVGDGPERSAIEAKAAELGIADALRFAGRVSHLETARYVSLCDVAVVPQTNAYRSPIKLFEYMALGKPVVAPRMPPIEAVVEDGRTGLLFEPNQLEGFVQALTRALLDRPLAAEIGRRAREHVLQNFTWNGHAAHILELVTRHERRSIPLLRGAAEPDWGSRRAG
jgi:glycosyltransferase involved in cell wall biosynthesis